MPPRPGPGETAGAQPDVRWCRPVMNTVAVGPARESGWGSAGLALVRAAPPPPTAAVNKCYQLGGDPVPKDLPSPFNSSVSARAAGLKLISHLTSHGTGNLGPIQVTWTTSAFLPLRGGGGAAACAPWWGLAAGPLPQASGVAPQTSAALGEHRPGLGAALSGRSGRCVEGGAPSAEPARRGLCRMCWCQENHV